VQKTTVTKIREATQDDVFDILILAKEFSKEAPKSHKWNKDKTEQFLFSALQNTNMTILVIDADGEIEGALVGLISELYMSYTAQATELAWFISKEHRGKPSSLKLIKSFERWAKDNGVNQIGMGDIEGISNLSKLYNRLGYYRAESVYLKEI
jgi:RimJ/RimL family protein N-acetyltransferase|tara:strand:+ start:10987 stop:11445 length:459 start_codon:yes stop_codon:yes gene_type:complete